MVGPDGVWYTCPSCEARWRGEHRCLESGRITRSKAVVTPRITELTFFAGDPDEEDAYAVEVTWRGGEKYAVHRRSRVWNGSEWEWEPQPSSREDDFLARTRFDFDTACDHARSLAEASL